MTAPGSESLLEASGLSKSYPGVRALSQVDFDLRRGQVHALVGENGAGKSTLAGIVSGLIRPEGGTMRLHGRPFAPQSKLEAEQAGVRMVMQELNLIGTLTVAENIFLDSMPGRWGLISYRKMNAAAAALLGEVGLAGVEPDRPVGSLGVGQRQMVEIARGLSRQCDVLILDEPTAALTDTEIGILFAHIERLKSAGVGVIYISHRMEEIQRIADRITVLRDGHVVATTPAAETTLEEIIQWMVGRELRDAQPARARIPGEVALRVRGLRRGRAVRDVSFDLHRGEILGFAGLMGSGRTETMRAIFGADRPDAGAVFLWGSDVPARIRSPHDAVRQGMALLTEDRKGQGLLLPLCVRVNVTLNRLEDVSGRFGEIRPVRERSAARRLAEMLSIRCTSIEQPVAELSGGNQQKVVVARWIFRNCDILLFDEPTRGIDVGAKFEIHERLSELAAEGKAVIMVSSDLKELLAVCDRIAVMSAGRLVRILDRGRFDRDQIMAAALSGYVTPQTQEAEP